MSEVVWNKYSKEEFNDVMKFSDGYIDFLSDSKTERACVKNAIALAKSYGYRDIKEVIENKEILKAQDKVYVNMMNKSIALMHIGSNPLEKGMNILGAHIDSPRLDLKQNPLYEDGNIAYLDTHYYGGVKKYQWVTLPLAIHGVVCLKDGTTVDVAIGDKESDPVFVISDLLIHLSACGSVRYSRFSSLLGDGQAPPGAGHARHHAPVLRLHRLLPARTHRHRDCRCIPGSQRQLHARELQ